MPHADSSLVPSTITTKTEFWEHVYSQLELLLDGQRNWVSNLANASSLIYNSLLEFPLFFGRDQGAVNWAGFYIDSTLFPRPRSAGIPEKNTLARLLLGPFCGKPACQFINVAPGRARGVCADAFVRRTTMLVKDVEVYPGHIACDGNTRSEIVCPLLVKGHAVGVLDLDCLALDGFNEEDQGGLERIAKLVADACDW